MSELIEHKDGYFFHPTSIIDSGVKLGQGSKIWHWVHISKGASVGSFCSLGQGVYVGSKVSIGDRVKIQNNVSVYDNVYLEEDVFCGPSVVFTNVYNPRSAVTRKDEYRDTFVRKGASLGANCTIVCGVEIGMHSFVAAGAVVNKNVKNYSLVAGVPAKHIGWISEFGERIHFEGDKSVCPHTKDIYYLQDDCVFKEKK
jgi:UDP-2-acetamido-3-amino-2,3-dideoxy-glucuronate N-acetyltransferase